MYEMQIRELCSIRAVTFNQTLSQEFSVSKASHSCWVFSWRNVWIFCGVLFAGEWMEALWLIYPTVSLGNWTILLEKNV